ncbi:DinB family protein [Haloechinothrix sp. YIM 98757]|uniref:DinB family protein n=1 Tax=Haloechinothrix aidingensis TaxID=2752311 RepID=A0A838ACQ5_9PSEU|nr:DinB family protein [Haloechinothrix aidingensis]MBA0127001.1 DinB family protein [Haloechinothrix aidingensis]
MTRCAGCGFVVSTDTEPEVTDDQQVADYDETAFAEAGERIVATVAEVVSLLEGTDAAALRVRPDPGTWSRLEYACHMRDVLIVQRERALRARVVECPDIERMGREERVEHDGYAEQHPVDVARQLTEFARLFTGVLARLGPQDWSRTLNYNWPDDRPRTLRWLAMHTLHEMVHHREDIRSQAG